jgi:hypothetical protein
MQARQASVNYIDETPWYCRNTLEWLWVMASERVAFYMILTFPYRDFSEHSCGPADDTP